MELEGMALISVIQQRNPHWTTNIQLFNLINIFSSPSELSEKAGLQKKGGKKGEKKQPKPAYPGMEVGVRRQFDSGNFATEISKDNQKERFVIQ